MQTPPDVFFHMTATGWAAIGSIVGAASIILLSIFNVLALRTAFRATKAAESQASLTERPFVAIHSEFCQDIEAMLVYAHNQGSGPALDVEASLTYTYTELPSRKHGYSIGCLAVDGKFQFRIGEESKILSGATIWYKSIAGEEWTTEVSLLGGHPAVTTVKKGFLDDGEHRRIQNILARATQTEE